jgi:hypothetical protein
MRALNVPVSAVGAGWWNPRQHALHCQHSWKPTGMNAKHSSERCELEPLLQSKSHHHASPSCPVGVRTPCFDGYCSANGQHYHWQLHPHIPSPSCPTTRLAERHCHLTQQYGMVLPLQLQKSLPHLPCPIHPRQLHSHVQCCPRLCYAAVCCFILRCVDLCHAVPCCAAGVAPVCVVRCQSYAGSLHQRAADGRPKR